MLSKNGHKIEKEWGNLYDLEGWVIRTCFNR